jgi:wyosine [tRNA(Phe)-imidazoG37] synthetase (radical SAM superfamily)
MADMAPSLRLGAHPRDILGNRYVYAVLSRRAAGLSIGVNLNPDKVCNFACVYCQVDRTRPGGLPEVEVDVLARELRDLLARARSPALWTDPPFDAVDPAYRRVADVAFSGDGEPTSAGEFARIAQLARRLRDESGLLVPLRLLTNATLFHREPVRRGLRAFDELWCKLDAGTDAAFAVVNGAGVPLDHVLSNLLAVARERPIVIQSLFISLSGLGPDGKEVAAYLGRLAALRDGGARIDRVQVTTLARRPADPRVGALPLPRLEAIAREVRDLGLRVDVYGSPAQAGEG